MRSVLVSHPHAAAVSVHVAAALEREGLLAKLVTGVAGTRESLMGRLLEAGSVRYPQLENRIIDGIAPAHIRSLAGLELLARGAARGASIVTRGSLKPYDVLFVTHDVAASTLSWPKEVDTVYGYEDAALCTFRKAERNGVGRVLDLPALWWTTIEGLWRRESERWPGAMGATPPLEPEWKKVRKNEELRLADVVSVASKFTRESLERVGLEKPIVTTPYPFPVRQFRSRDVAPSGPFTVLSVGTQDARKGTPYLLEAWQAANLKDARLRIVGPMKLARGFLDRFADMFEHVPRLPKAQLESEYQSADILAFPTLGDGFGLVIQEAMCCGTPVVTTRCSGGPECIEDGQNGLIVEERSVDALVAILRWASVNRGRLYELGAAARRRAETYTLREFAPRLVGGLRAALSGTGNDR